MVLVPVPVLAEDHAIANDRNDAAICVRISIDMRIRSNIRLILSLSCNMRDGSIFVFMSSSCFSVRVRAVISINIPMCIRMRNSNI